MYVFQGWLALGNQCVLFAKEGYHLSYSQLPIGLRVRLRPCGLFRNHVGMSIGIVHVQLMFSVFSEFIYPGINSSNFQIQTYVMSLNLEDLFPSRSYVCLCGQILNPRQSIGGWEVFIVLIAKIWSQSQCLEIEEEK